VFQDAPISGDETRWPFIFREEFADLPGVQHILFTWATRLEGSLEHPEEYPMTYVE
jgi:hypothetical protein